MAKLGSPKEPEIPKSQIIQVNPYEIPEKTLQMTTRISTAKSCADASVIYNEFSKRLLSSDNIKDNIYEFLKSIEPVLFDKNFWTKLRTCLQNLRIQLEAKENTEHTQIVVAGSFSSGKSTFLNSILCEPDLLPTNIEAASVVPTYLYCSQKTNTLQVKGVSFKNAIVGLDKDVLQCIQHGSKSNAYISPLLKRLLIEIHSEEHNGIAYIDTPGYNNYEKMVDDDEKTDRQTAINALSEGNVLFWLRDIEDGAISQEDRSIINMFKGKIVIIFNKADLKTEKEIKEIITSTQKDFNAKSKKSNIIDIIAYSSFENKIYYSMRDYNMTKLLKKVKSSGVGQNEIHRIQKQIDSLFDTELDFQRNEAIRLKEEWKLSNHKKDKANRDYINNRESNTDLLDALSESRIPNENFVRVKDKLDELNSKYKSEYYHYAELCSDIEKRRKQIIKITNEIARFKDLVSSCIKRGIKLYKPTVTLTESQPSGPKDKLDIFSAINTRDMNAFLDCFAEGLDIIKTLHNGYTPLTYAVKYGENDMVKFFIKHGADLHVYDGRGYNAFLTAVENNYKDLCEILLAEDPSLLNTKTADGLSAIEIARLHSFESWLSELKTSK